MKKVLLCILATLIFTFSLTGCWDYKSLDTLTIVAGIAIDRSKEDPDKYLISLEILDTANSKATEEIGSIVVSSEGYTVFQAIENVNMQLYTEIYLGNMEVIILSYELAESNEIESILETFLRNGLTRENISIFISKTDTAKEILEGKNENSVISYYINKSIAVKQTKTTTTRVLDMHKIYEYLTVKSDNLALPVLNVEEKDGNTQVFLDGMAIFDEKNMIGFLEQEYTPYFLLVICDVHGGTFDFKVKDSEGEAIWITLTIEESSKEVMVDYDGEKFIIDVKIELFTSADELSPKINNLSDENVLNLEECAEQALIEKINGTIQYIQEKYKSDVFGFAHSLYRHKYELWEQVNNNWNDHFSNAEINIECEVQIDSVGALSVYKEE